jgi:cellulose synthase/poly-beta-1,6-N-acetylglucosamine synthase-like glycosyltransferase
MITKQRTSHERLISFFHFIFGVPYSEQVPESYNPTVAVLIPAYNEEASIADTIESISKQTYSRISKIIVVDDCSTDKTGDIARSLNAIVVRTPNNTGTKSRAQNFAILEKNLVDTDLLVTLDADTELAAKAIENIVPAMFEEGTLSACGFVIPQVIETFWEIARFGQYLYCIGLNKKAQNNLGVPLVSSGCFSIFNTKSLIELGGFPNETIVEDMALTWKGHILGYKIKFISSALCFPKDPHSWKIYRGQVLRWYRGFLQCVGLYKFEIFKNKKMGLFISWYVFSGLIAPLSWILVLIILPFLLLSGRLVPSIFILTWFIVDITISFAIIMYEGWRHDNLKKAFQGFFLYWIEAPIESYLFVVSFYNEWILKRSLTKWDKGH